MLFSQDLFTKEAKYGCLLISSFFLGLSIFMCVIVNPFNCVTGDQFRGLHDGMTKAEVIELLGQPHGRDFKNGKEDDDVWIYWGCSGGSDPAWISFDEDGRLHWTAPTNLPADAAKPANR